MPVRPTPQHWIESYSVMVLWIILGMGWLAILFAGISLFRLADYADKKVRRLAERPRQRRKQAA